MKVVVVLPTYNERENIETVLRGLAEVTKSLKRYDFRFLVVDDTSPDGTAEAVRAYQKTHHNVALILGKKEGLGKAILRGMMYAADRLNAEIILQMDADLSHDWTKIPAFMSELENGADFVVGSRYIPGGAIPENWGLHRKIYSIFGNAFVRYGLGFSSVHDWTGGFRAYGKRYVSLARAEMGTYRGYVFQIAFLHKAILAGARVAEVPFHFTDRRFGRSKIAPSEYIRDVIGYVVGERLQQMVRGTFGKFLVVGGIGFVINTVVLEAGVRFGMHPALGSAFGAELAIISNYFWNNRWTFQSQRISGVRNILKFLQFNTTSLGALLIQSGVVALGTFFFGVGPYRFFYMLGVGIGLFWNYFMYSKIIWKKT